MSSHGGSQAGSDDEEMDNISLGGGLPDNFDDIPFRSKHESSHGSGSGAGGDDDEDLFVPPAPKKLTVPSKDKMFTLSREAGASQKEAPERYDPAKVKRQSLMAMAAELFKNSSGDNEKCKEKEEEEEEDLQETKSSGKTMPPGGKPGSKRDSLMDKLNDAIDNGIGSSGGKEKGKEIDEEKEEDLQEKEPTGKRIPPGGKPGGPPVKLLTPIVVSSPNHLFKMT